MAIDLNLNLHLAKAVGLGFGGSRFYGVCPALLIAKVE